MDPNFLEKANLVVQIVSLLTIAILSSRYLGKGRNILPTFFFTFAIVSVLLSDLYWITFDLLRPGERMPIAANEICESAYYLLICASVSSMKIHQHKSYLEELIPAMVILVCNVALWIVWSGEWLQDIVTGIVMSVLLYTLIKNIKQIDIMPKYGWWLIGGVGTLAVALQTVTILNKGLLGKITDITTYILIIALIVWFDIQIIIGIKNKKKETYILSVMGVLWSFLSLYMTTGYVYIFVALLVDLSFILMYLALRVMNDTQGGVQNDLC